MDLRGLEAALSVTYTHVYSRVVPGGNRTNTDLVQAGHSWGGLLPGTVDIHHVVNQLLDEPGCSIGKDPRWGRWCLHWELSRFARLGRTWSFLTLIFGDPGILMGSLRPRRLFQ